jgi:hypothetical protein
MINFMINFFVVPSCFRFYSVETGRYGKNICHVHHSSFKRREERRGEERNVTAGRPGVLSTIG